LRTITVQHCARTYFFAGLLAAKQKVKVDLELLFLASILHDLGLTELFMGPERCEVQGADAAGSFLRTHGVATERTSIVSDAIVVHSSGFIAERRQPKIALLSVATGMDVVGYRIGEFSRGGFSKSPLLSLACTSRDSVRHDVWAVDSDQAISGLRTMDRVIADSSAGGDLIAKMLSTFALVALFIAAIGLFGVLSYLVAQRTHEMGIRLALGSKPWQVLGLVLRNGLLLVGTGVMIGSAASLELPKLIAASFDAPEVRMISSGGVITAGALVLLVTGIVACHIPAQRVAGVDPMVALRYE
jgi:hypothetical protein